MSRTRRTTVLAIAAATATATLLTGCQQDIGTGGSASPSSSGSAQQGARTAGDVGPDGADASRREVLTDDGGYVVRGSRIAFVYRNGTRYTVDVGQQIPAGDTTLRTASGVLVLKGGSATWTQNGAATTVDARGAGAVADRGGAIVVTPDGSVTCANSQGLQFVGSNGSRAAANTGGAFYTDREGKQVTLGQTPGATTLAGRYTVCNVGDTASMDLFSDVLFEFDSDRLTPAGRAVVASAASTIRQDVQGKTVQVVGHTDSKGTTAYNQQLGQRRATTVANELRRQVPGATLQVRSAGETEPVAANVTPDGKDNPNGRAKNRRVTLTWEK